MITLVETRLEAAEHLIRTQERTGPPAQVFGRPCEGAHPAPLEGVLLMKSMGAPEHLSGASPAWSDLLVLLNGLQDLSLGEAHHGQASQATPQDAGPALYGPSSLQSRTGSHGTGAHSGPGSPHMQPAGAIPQAVPQLLGGLPSMAAGPSQAPPDPPVNTAVQPGMAYMPVGPGLTQHPRAPMGPAPFMQIAMSPMHSQQAGMVQQEQQADQLALAQLRSRRAQQQRDQEKIRRTIYVRGVDQQVTEAQLAAVFEGCGPVVDCRVCGEPHSSVRFAFIEFLTEAGAQQALSKSGCVLGLHELQVSPSKTAIVPVKTDFLPTSITEHEAVARTIYVANIDKTVEREALRAFLARLCGPITKLRLLADTHHASKIAFVEFETAASARQALHCSGALLGSQPLRIFPSKTPVRLEARNATQPRSAAFQPLGAPYANWQ